ncbi:hypothetical protein GCM10009120_31820 [Sphingobacterium siyangense subsp. cladoniae]
MIMKSQYLSYFVHADRRVGHNLRVILPQKYGYSYSSKTNGDNWSVSSEIPWSFSAGTSGHFIPKSGGQYKRNLQLNKHGTNELKFNKNLQIGNSLHIL